MIQIIITILIGFLSGYLLRGFLLGPVYPTPQKDSKSKSEASSADTTTSTTAATFTAASTALDKAVPAQLPFTPPALPSLLDAAFVPPPVSPRNSSSSSSLSSSSSIEFPPSLSASGANSSDDTTSPSPTSTFSFIEDGRRRRLVIVSLHLPISAQKGPDGQWSIEWDNPRSDHMTPNLRMLTETMDVTWVGWPGVFIPKSEEDEFTDLLEKFNCRPVYLTPELKEMFFDRCSKGLLWPLMHYRMPTTDPDFAKNWDTLWQAYTTANMFYSKQVSAIVESDRDFIWVHNYHLFLVPSFLRKKMPRARVGFFLHTPFPTSDVFRAVPGRANILRGILCSDLIGFHTYDYARHFLSSVRRVLDLEVESLPGGSLGVTYNGRAVCIRISHVGIPSEIYQQASVSEVVLARVEEIRKQFAGRKIVLGVDDYDIVKGTLLKFQAYERFLSTHPEYRREIVLVEIISNSYNSQAEKNLLRQQVMEEVENIHRLYGKDVLHIVEPPSGKFIMDVNELVAYYRSAHVGLISTFWDGLNLIPYEFTACQDEQNPAALIVSEFMGCSRSLSGVLRVNPWRLEEVSDAIVSALTMEPEELKGNHRRRCKYVMNHTLKSWAEGFLQDLEKAAKHCEDLNLVQVGWGSNVCLIGLRKNFQHLEADDINFNFRRANRRVLIFDYDGTLTSETDRYLCRPSDQLLGHLQNLCSDPRNIVFIMSGRERKVLSDWFSSVKNLGLASEKGCFVRWPGSEHWQITHSVDASEWKPIALELLQQYTERTDGSYVEDKESAVVWHFEAADVEFGRMQASELLKFLQNVLSLYHVDVVKYDYNRILEVKPKGINKGVTTKAILHRVALQLQQEQQSSQAPVFILCVGDDRSDEDMFVAINSTSVLQELNVVHSSSGSVLPPKIYTCCVGLKPSHASHYLHDPQEVLDTIEGLSTCSDSAQSAFHQFPVSPQLNGSSKHSNLSSSISSSSSSSSSRTVRGSLTLGSKSGLSSLSSLSSLSTLPPNLSSSSSSSSSLSSLSVLSSMPAIPPTSSSSSSSFSMSSSNLSSLASMTHAPMNSKGSFHNLAALANGGFR